MLKVYSSSVMPVRSIGAVKKSVVSTCRLYVNGAVPLAGTDHVIVGVVVVSMESVTGVEGVIIPGIAPVLRYHTSDQSLGVPFVARTRQ